MKRKLGICAHCLNGGIMLELFQGQLAYKDLSSEEFLKLCYGRLTRISQM